MPAAQVASRHVCCPSSSVACVPVPWAASLLATAACAAGTGSCLPLWLGLAAACLWCGWDWQLLAFASPRCRSRHVPIARRAVALETVVDKAWLLFLTHAGEARELGGLGAPTTHAFRSAFFCVLQQKRGISASLCVLQQRQGISASLCALWQLHSLFCWDFPSWLRRLRYGASGARIRSLLFPHKDTISVWHQTVSVLSLPVTLPVRSRPAGKPSVRSRGQDITSLTLPPWNGPPNTHTMLPARCLCPPPRTLPPLRCRSAATHRPRPRMRCNAQPPRKRTRRLPRRSASSSQSSGRVRANAPAPRRGTAAPRGERAKQQRATQQRAAPLPPRHLDAAPPRGRGSRQAHAHACGHGSGQSRAHARGKRLPAAACAPASPLRLQHTEHGCLLYTSPSPRD